MVEKGCRFFSLLLFCYLASRELILAELMKCTFLKKLQVFLHNYCSSSHTLEPHCHLFLLVESLKSKVATTVYTAKLLSQDNPWIRQCAWKRRFFACLSNDTSIYRNAWGSEKIYGHGDFARGPTITVPKRGVVAVEYDLVSWKQCCWCDAEPQLYDVDPWPEGGNCM